MQEEQYWTASSKVAAQIEAASPRQVVMLALALLVCECKSTTSRTTWRRPRARDRQYMTVLIVSRGFHRRQTAPAAWTRPSSAAPSVRSATADLIRLAACRDRHRHRHEERAFSFASRTSF